MCTRAGLTFHTVAHWGHLTDKGMAPEVLPPFRTPGPPLVLAGFPQASQGQPTPQCKLTGIHSTNQYSTFSSRKSCQHHIKCCLRLGVDLQIRKPAPVPAPNTLSLMHLDGQINCLKKWSWGDVLSCSGSFLPAYKYPLVSPNLKI